MRLAVSHGCCYARIHRPSANWTGFLSFTKQSHNTGPLVLQCRELENLRTQYYTDVYTKTIGVMHTNN